MANPNPFQEQCPNCSSYNVSLFGMYIVLWEVIVGGIFTLGIGLLIFIPAYIGSVIARNRNPIHYTCMDCGKKWQVTK